MIGAVAVYAALFALAFMHYGMPKAFYQQHTAPPLSAVVFTNIGPPEYVGHYTAPKYETECIRATGECRTIMHPLLNRKLATVCKDPNAPGGVVFYNKADRFCE